MSELPIVKRFEVVVERKFIIYAPDVELAGMKALAFEGFKGDLSKAPIRVSACVELPAIADEKSLPVIDRAPSRESAGK